MEAKITDELSNKALKGNDAFNQLRPKFENSTFDSSTPDEEVISEVSKAFNISKNYYSFELDVEFTDGKEKRYNKMNK